LYFLTRTVPARLATSKSTVATITLLRTALAALTLGVRLGSKSTWQLEAWRSSLETKLANIMAARRRMK